MYLCVYELDKPADNHFKDIFNSEVDIIIKTM